ncbi:hypothetical protein IHE44_0011731 [Lamprotornis superbus]|uniref:Uncharacterized protein n=1 Tax=Lamprotornis superbus TaxID=245042 RepID=A0A835NJN8_9PASS|nr:hypothetical protein IHE44_0011731 [Lamprotornis superbus]
MANAGGEDLYSTAIFQEEGSPPSTYAIVMVSLSGSLLLLVAISMAISVLRRGVLHQSDAPLTLQLFNSAIVPGC